MRKGASNIITLTTDFGLIDPYVGIMKGVILSINPKASITDISHGIAPGSITEASAILIEAVPFFPAGTIHLVVVDPGVGGKRRPIIIEAGGHLFVGPDNGVILPAAQSLGDVSIRAITKRAYSLPAISSTFHGRDIFAPAAAHLSIGASPLDFGEPVDDPVVSEPAGPEKTGEQLHGAAVRIDRFGNIITDIKGKMLEEFLLGKRPVLRIGQTEIQGLSKTYCAVEKGKPLALIGSSGFLEISVNQGRASDLPGVEKKEAHDIKVSIRRHI